jgi:Protein of unknown function (DUF998)
VGVVCGGIDCGRLLQLPVASYRFPVVWVCELGVWEMTSIIGRADACHFIFLRLIRIWPLTKKMSLGKSTWVKFLLLCGILSSVHYVAINIIVPLYYEGYRMASFTVSELSAIGAPTRTLWIVSVIPYILFFASFGWGVLKMAGTNRPLRKVGWLILVYSVFNIYWPPMHMRGLDATLTDALHITWASVTVLMMMIMMGYGAASFGKGFRLFTIFSMLLLLAFGILTGLESPNIPVNGPTPMIGIWERINIGLFLLWVVVLAVMLLQRMHEPVHDR